MRTEVRRLLKRESQARLGLEASKKGDLLYRTPADWLAVGLFLDWSELDSFYLHALAVPLYVPYRVLSLSVGDRLCVPNSSLKGWPPRWRPELGEADEQLLTALRSALSAATPLLDSVATLEGYIGFLNRRVDPKRKNPIFQEEIAYASLLRGRPPRRTRRELQAVLEVVKERKEDHWEVNGEIRYRSPDQFQEVAERVSSVIALLDEGEDPVEQLRAWREERVGHLGLISGVSQQPDLPRPKWPRITRLR